MHYYRYSGVKIRREGKLYYVAKATVSASESGTVKAFGYVNNHRVWLTYHGTITDSNGNAINAKPYLHQVRLDLVEKFVQTHERKGAKLTA